MSQLLAQRMASQFLSRRARSVAAVARQMLGMQAQDLAQVHWALATRAEGATMKTVERAVASRQIVRIWPMRGTLHLVHVEDAAWLTALFAKHNLARAARRLREIGVEGSDVLFTRKVIERVLTGRKLLRDDLFRHLEEAGQRTGKQRGGQLLWHLVQDGVLCLAGEHFVLAEEWLPRPRRLVGDEALGELATRYLRGHGPASLEDLAFWSGLPKGIAKRGVEIAGDVPVTTGRDVPNALLLPGFDEYLLGYAERSHCLEQRHSQRIVPGGNGVFMAMLILDGSIRGTWRRRIEQESVAINVAPFVRLAPSQRQAIERAAADYGAFLGRAVTVSYP